MVEQKLKCVFLPIDELPAPTRSPLPASPVKETVVSKESEVVKRLTLACEGYKLEIDRLNGVRSRGGAGEKGGDVKTVVVGGDKGVAGMSVQVALLIAVCSFLMGVILF